MYPSTSETHESYQKSVVDQLQKHYTNPSKLPSDLLKIAERLWALDLSFVDKLMCHRYSIMGSKPRQPSCMLRSMLLYIFLGFSYSKWVEQMRLVPAYAIISGFTFGNTPGVGTFVDFFSRLWMLDKNNVSPHEHPPKLKVKKPKTKGEKADSVEKITVEELIAAFSTGAVSTSQPFSLLVKVFQHGFVDQSIQRGLIDPNELAFAGDGTPVVTSARERSHRICTCKEDGTADCSCDRYFSQPDCDIGWDSSRNCFYSGYDLYLLTASDSQSDLPLFPLLAPASRHDSLGFLHCFFTMKTFFPQYTISKLLLDSAHDAMPLYEYCRKQDIVSFIDLNQKRGIKTIKETTLPLVLMVFLSV